MKEKREIIGSTFPEKLYFDDTGCRTAKINEGVLLIYQLINKLQGQKKRTSDDLIRLSNGVIPLGFEPRTHTLKVYCSTS